MDLDKNEIKKSLLVLRHVFKSYAKDAQKISVLRDLSLEIRVGEFVAIIGASGAGKSTLLHVMGTLDTPDSGEILYNDRMLHTLSALELAQFRNKHMGFVFQFHHLLAEFSALENVMMPALIQRLSFAEARERAHQILDWVGLSHRETHKPGELSGGEQQRVALARALVLNPPLVMADEATGNLDDKTGRMIQDLLFRLNTECGTTVVVVTHQQSWTQRIARCLHLENGVLRENCG